MPQPLHIAHPPCKSSLQSSECPSISLFEVRGVEVVSCWNGMSCLGEGLVKAAGRSSHSCLGAGSWWRRVVQTTPPSRVWVRGRCQWWLWPVGMHNFELIIWMFGRVTFCLFVYRWVETQIGLRYTTPINQLPFHISGSRPSLMSYQDPKRTPVWHERPSRPYFCKIQCHRRPQWSSTP